MKLKRNDLQLLFFYLSLPCFCALISASKMPNPERRRSVHFCKVPNDCVNSSFGPVCLQVPALQAKVCSQCDPTVFNKDCQCPIGSYCIGDPENV